MQGIVIGGYLFTAAMFLMVTVLLALAWRGQRNGALLILAVAVTTLWSGLLAFAAWKHALPFHWLLLAEVMRYGAWLVFVGALFRAWHVSGLLRGFRVMGQVLWIGLAAYCLVPILVPATAHGGLFNISVPLVGMLLLALVGLVFLEQIFRNSEPRQRWALKFLLIPLVGMFAYDIFLYSYAVLYHAFNASAWAARGFVDGVLAPLLLVAAARNRRWSLEVGVSRGVVFYSASLLVVACYIIAIAAGGYYVRLYGGDWGKVAEIALICLALLLMLLVISSGQVRSRLKIFLHKNFFSLRHDYRQQWLRLTATMAAGDADAELSVRAVRALAQTMDSPAGALFMRNDAEVYAFEASWNMQVPSVPQLDAGLPVFDFMRARRWIYDLDEAVPLHDEQLRVPAELSVLPHAWLLVPLLLQDELVGFVVLAQARARRDLDWEDIDLLRTAGSQVADTLMQAANARDLAEVRQFEGFNRLTAFLMHDLKNVAAQQSLLLQNAERHKNNPAFVDDMLATVGNSVRRINRLLEQLRGDRTGSGGQRVRLAAVVDKALAGCQAHEPQPRFEPAALDPWVHADAEQLASALEHLVRNAQDAARAEGHVHVRLAQHDAEAVLEIVDDGYGMEEEFIRNRLFKPFFTTKGSRGMGIGAYQAREYVRRMGGALEVASMPGQGTTFTIRLPLAGMTDDMESGDNLKVTT